MMFRMNVIDKETLVLQVLIWVILIFRLHRMKLLCFNSFILNSILGSTNSLRLITDMYILGSTSHERTNYFHQLDLPIDRIKSSHNLRFYRLVFSIINSNINFDWLIGMNKI
jgi:hypothetical protein